MDELEDTVQLNHQMAPKVFRQHEWILIRTEMTTEDDVAINNRLAKMSNVKQGQKPEITMTLGDSKLATLQRMIVGWNLTRTVYGPDGSNRDLPIPYSSGAVRNLPKRITDFVMKKINEYNPDMDEEEQESFLPSVIDASEDNLQAERVYRLK